MRNGTVREWWAGDAGEMDATGLLGRSEFTASLNKENELTLSQYELDSLHGRTVPKLGILAAAQLDGSISFYPVPHPKILRRMRGDLVSTDTTPLFGKCRRALKAVC